MIKIRIAFMIVISVVGSLDVLAAERMPGPNPQQVTIRLLEYRFEPAQITLKAGQAVELILINEGTVMHEFITEATKNLEVDVDINGVITETLGVAELEIPPGARAVLRFTPEKTGQFPFTCRAMEPVDHFKEGMAGKMMIRTQPVTW